MNLNEFRNLVREIVLEMVDEAKGVSSEVEEEARAFTRDLMEIIDEMKYDYNTNPHGRNVEYLDCNLFGLDITIKLIVHFCENEKIFHEQCKGRVGEYRYDNGKRLLTITVYKVGDTVVNNTMETKLSHEFRHVQQYAMYKKPKGSYLLNPSYYGAVNEIGKGYLETAVGNAIYLSTRFESEAYGEELYNELMISDKPLEQAFKESNSYQAYQSLINSLRIIVANKDKQNLHDVIKKHGHQYNHIIRKGKNTCGLFRKRLIRAYTQAVEDKKKENE